MSSPSRRQYLRGRFSCGRGHALRGGRHQRCDFATDAQRMRRCPEDLMLRLRKPDQPIKDLLPLLEEVMQMKPLPMISEDVEGEALVEPGGQQDPWDLQHGSPPRSCSLIVARPCSATPPSSTWWPGHLREGRGPASTLPTSTVARPQGRRHQGRDDHRRGCGDEDQIDASAQPDLQKSRSRERDPTVKSFEERLASSPRCCVIKAGAATEVEEGAEDRIEDAEADAPGWASRRASSPAAVRADPGCKAGSASSSLHPPREATRRDTCVSPSRPVSRSRSTPASRVASREKVRAELEPAGA